jgi:phage gp36-like protein
MDPLRKISDNARRGRAEAIELLTSVNAGTARLGPGITREQAVEILNGCISDYSTMIKRFGRY